MSKDPKKEEQKKADLGVKQVAIAITGLEFKTRILQNLVRHQAMPMLVVWWDDERGWCSGVGNDLHVNGSVRKSVSGMLFKMITELRLFDETRAD